MQLARPAFALDPRSFGRGRRWVEDAVQRRWAISDDLKLFATTFVAGFIVVSVLIG
jgi:hypothetical protein